MTEKNRIKLKKTIAGIAGLGGLGSNVATFLARAGIGKLIIVDFDIVEPTNLSRQQYFIEQIGRPKAEATKENIAKIDPNIEVVAINEKLNPDNICEIFGEADVVAECFDRADQKQMLVETVLAKMSNILIVSASGLAGTGNSNAIQTRKISDRFILVGDNESEANPGIELTAPRVAIAAAHQANAIVEHLLAAKK